MSLTPPELLRLAQVRVDDEGDEAVRVRLRLDQGAVEPELEVGVGPDLDDRVLLAGGGGAAAAAGDEIGAVEEYGLLVGEVVAAGDAPEAADVVAEPPGKEALDVRRGDADAALERVPRDLESAVAEDRRVDLVVEVELAEVVGVGDGAQGLLRPLGPLRLLGRAVLLIDDEAEAGHQVRRRLVDHRLGVVEDEAALAAALAAEPLLAAVEGEVVAVGAEAAAVEAAELFDEVRFGAVVLEWPLSAPWLLAGGGGRGSALVRRWTAPAPGRERRCGGRGQSARRGRSPAGLPRSEGRGSSGRARR